MAPGATTESQHDTRRPPPSLASQPHRTTQPLQALLAPRGTPQPPPDPRPGVQRHWGGAEAGRGPSGPAPGARRGLPRWLGRERGGRRRRCAALPRRSRARRGERAPCRRPPSSPAGLRCILGGGWYFFIYLLFFFLSSPRPRSETGSHDPGSNGEGAGWKEKEL